jgi:hypothetical protein
VIGQRSIQPGELGDIDSRDLPDAMAAARRLESALDGAPVRASDGFADRLMAALADEPAPAPAGFLVPIRRRGLLGGFGLSVRQAWASLSAGRPALVRSAALAYVLVVAIAGVSIAGAATLGAASAFNMLGPGPTESPQPTAPEPTLGPPEPTVPPSISPTDAPPVTGPSPTPSETPDESDDGGNSGPGGGDGGDDSSGPGSGGDDNSGPGGGGDDNSGPGSGDGDSSGSGSDGSGSGSGGSGSGSSGRDGSGSSGSGPG